MFAVGQAEGRIPLVGAETTIPSYTEEPDDSTRGRVRIEPTRAAVDFGDHVRFSCIHPDSGLEQIQYVWSRDDGAPLTSRAVPNGNYLDIYEASDEEFGQYVCTTQTASSTDRAVALLIHGVGEVPVAGVLPTVLTGTLAPPSGTVLTGTVPPPGGRVAETPVPLESGGNILPPSPGRVQVQPSRLPIRRGDNARFTCIDEDDGLEDQRTRYEWSREDGAPLPSRAVKDANYLDIYEVEPEDAGAYTCTAQTGAATGVAVGELIVMEGGAVVSPDLFREEPITTTGKVFGTMPFGFVQSHKANWC